MAFTAQLQYTIAVQQLLSPCGGGGSGEVELTETADHHGNIRNSSLYCQQCLDSVLQAGKAARGDPAGDGTVGQARTLGTISRTATDATDTSLCLVQ